MAKNNIGSAGKLHYCVIMAVDAPETHAPSGQDHHSNRDASGPLPLQKASCLAH